MIATPHAGQSLGDRLEQSVPPVPSEGVVENPKAVHVDQKKGVVLAAGLGLFVGKVEKAVDDVAVRQPGQAILKGELFRLFSRQGLGVSLLKRGPSFIELFLGVS